MSNSGNEHCTDGTERCDCGIDDDLDENGQCRVCADPGAYSTTVGSPDTSKSAERKRKEDHVW